MAAAGLVWQMLQRETGKTLVVAMNTSVACQLTQIHQATHILDPDMSSLRVVA